MAKTQSPTQHAQPQPRGRTPPSTLTEPTQPHHPWAPTRAAKRPFSALRDVEQFHDVEFANESKIFRPWIGKPQRIS